MKVQTGPYFQTYAEGRDAPVRWRLLSGNHRDLGRGTVDYLDAESCVQGIRILIERLDSVDLALLRAEGHRWSWRMSDRAVVVASSGHSFDRRTRCEQGFALFVQLAPTATIRDELAVWPVRMRAGRPNGRPALSTRVGTSWPAVHPRSAERSSRPGYLEGRAEPIDPTNEPREASR